METFFTGLPCKHGHVAPRYKCNRWCTECAALQKRGTLADRKWRAENRERLLEAKRKWRRDNPDKNAAGKARYRAKCKQATPKWLTDEQHQQIDFMYFVAVHATQFSNVLYQVDHIVPLQGKNVSGLHVPWNLHLMTKLDNQKKWNSLE